MAEFNLVYVFPVFNTFWVYNFALELDSGFNINSAVIQKTKTKEKSLIICRYPFGTVFKQLFI